jgi:hypothetical protein
VTSEGRTPTKPLIVALVALVVAAAFGVKILDGAKWDPSVFVAFGDTNIPTKEFAEERVGRVYLRIGQGHDGKYFFVQAHDPLLLEPAENASALDRPLYRSQRMLYPLLAGGVGFLDSTGVMWGLYLVNVLALGAGTYATGVVARRMGGSAWWGLAFALNIGLISEINIDGAGVLAAALAFGGVAAAMSGKDPWAVALLGLSALSREVMLVVALGVGWWLWRDGRRRLAALCVTVPVALVGLWALYLRLRLGWASGATEAGLAFEPPFVGLVKAFPAWLDSPLDMVAGLAVLLLLGAYLYRTVKSNALVGWAFVGFVPLTLVLSELVWRYYFDSTRAVAPMITAFVLMVFVTEEKTLSAEPSSSELPSVGA